MTRLYIFAGALAAIVLGGGFWWMSQGPAQNSGQAIEVAQADLTKGEALFNESCLMCHGPSATGSDNGPPLVHKIYEPSHYADMSFYTAAQNGVRAHHWRFGNMPKIETVDKDDVSYIIAYVRSLQRANGIF